MDRLEAMSILVAVDEGGSLTEASKKLKIPLATVSRKISEIESYLEVKLLIRSTRSIEFTDTGRSYLVYCRRILDDIQEAERAVTGEYTSPKGHLTITAPMVFGRLFIAPLVTDFLKVYPDVDVQLTLTDRSLDLLEDKIDLALRMGELKSSNLVALRIGTIRFVTCGAPDYLKQFGYPKIPQDLSQHKCINISVLGSPTKWHFPSKQSKLVVPIHSRLDVSAPEAGLEAAALGAGITRALSYQVASYKKDKRLEIILQDFEPEPWPVHLIHPAGRIVPLKLRAFLDFVSPRLRAELNHITKLMK